MIAATGTAAREAAMKVAGGGRGPLVVALAVASVTTLVLAPFLVTRMVAPGPGFWPALAASGTINAIALTLIATSVGRSDLSLVAPLQSLTPAFMLLTAPLVLGEVAGPQGAAGVFVLVAGSYLLAVPSAGRGLLAPFRALLRDRGARAMMAVAVLYSVSAVIDKIGVLASSPLLWSAAMHAFVAVVLTPMFLFTRHRLPKAAVHGTGPSRRDIVALALAGVFTAAAVVGQMSALELQQATYVIAIKRTSTLMAVLVGGLMFRERAALPRAAGAALMFCGFLLITFA